MGAAILYGHVTPTDRPVTVEKFRDQVSVGPAVPARQKGEFTPELKVSLFLLVLKTEKESELRTNLFLSSSILRIPSGRLRQSCRKIDDLVSSIVENHA